MLSTKSGIMLFVIGLGLLLPPKVLKADIIDDIEELEQKDKDKEQNKPLDRKKGKKEPTDAEKPLDGSGVTPIGGKKPPKPKTIRPENPDPEIQTQALIPEPVDDPVASNPPPKSPGLNSAKGKTKDQRRKAPVHFQCDGGATYSNSGLTAALEKNVVITQDDLKLQSDEAKLNFNPKNAAEKVKNAILQGKVAITRYSSDPSERMNAKSDKAIFDNSGQIVTLEGNARLWRDGDVLRGERIVYDLTSGQVKVDKAQGVMQPDRMKK